MPVQCLVEWYFPSTNGGVEIGFNDSAEEHFRSKPLESMVRETLQNSLDAVHEEHVKVSMQIVEIAPSEINAKGLGSHIMQAISEENGRNPEAVKFYKNAQKLLKKKKLPVLAIIDSGTTGLTGDKWKNLVRGEGTPDKSGIGSPGGSFGIGKNAPQVLSQLRTICYSTRYPERGRQEKFMIRCRLQAHPNPKNSSEVLQHMGFGCITKPGLVEPRPLMGKDIPRSFRLKERGTGVFVIGFENIPNWSDQAKFYASKHFFAAIHDKKITLEIESDKIDHQNLAGILRRGDDEPSSYYYQAMRKPEKTATITDEYLGSFEISLRTWEQTENTPNRIAYVNRPGMLVTQNRTFTKNPFHVKFDGPKFAAVVRAADDETDKRIREMEPPDHTSIEYEHIRGDPKRKKKLKESLLNLNQQIREFIDGFFGENAQDYIALGDLQHLFSTQGGDKSSDGDYEPDGDLEFKKRPHMKSTNATAGSGEGGAGRGKSDDIIGGEGGAGRNHGGKNDDSNAGQDGSTVMQKRRAIRVGNTLKVAFTLSEPTAIRFSIRPAGEERKNETDIRIDKCVAVGHNDIMPQVKNGIITIPALRAGRIMLEIPVAGEYSGYEIVERMQ